MKTYIREFLRHLRSWLEIYLWVPIFLVGILGAIRYAHYITGRPPASPESVDWLVEFSYRLIACIFVVVLVSITRQQTGIWMTKEEEKQNVALAGINAATKCFFALLFAYILLH